MPHGEGKTLTRSRPYKMNQSAHVEYKNWLVARRIAAPANSLAERH